MLLKYKPKEPSEVEAIVWDGTYESGKKLAELSNGKVTCFKLHEDPGEVHCHVHRLDRIVTVNPGDYVVREATSQWDRYKPEAFHHKYELVYYPSMDLDLREKE